LKNIIKSAFRKAGITLRFTKHEPKGVDFFRDILNLPHNITIQTIFDVGANVGDMSSMFARTFPQAQIYAFEPISSTYQTLCRNIGNRAGIKCNHCALGSTPGIINVSIQDASAWNSLKKTVAVGGKSEDVTVITLDSFIKESRVDRIDILKIDTEGYELEVLKGAEETLRAGKVLFIYAECTFYPEDTDHTYFNNIKSYLDNLNYDFFALYDLNHIPSNPTKLHYCNAVFIRGGGLGARTR
jgi:FkbM family methyltransferase